MRVFEDLGSILTYFPEIGVSFRNTIINTAAINERAAPKKNGAAAPNPLHPPTPCQR